jgi:hypothetical protein
MSRHLAPALTLVALLTVAACSGDDDSSDTTTAGSTASTTATPAADGSTVPGATTPDGSPVTTSGSPDGEPGTASSTPPGGSTSGTVAGDGAAASTTEPSPPAPTEAPGPTNAIPQTDADLVLLSDGLGPLKFGADSDEVVAAISAVVGQPTSDAPGEYPVARPDGSFQSEDEELGFAQPFGRTVCWQDGLCIENGGTTAGPYTFLGWYYAATGPDTLAAPSGLDVGSTWADFQDIMTVEPGGCATVGHGSSYGVQLNLLSSGTPFVTTDANGTETNTTPDPKDVTVQQMEAGQQITFLQDAC